MESRQKRLIVDKDGIGGGVVDVSNGEYKGFDNEAYPICIENAEDGVIDIDADFPSGHPAPSAHPNCECNLGASVAKE